MESLHLKRVIFYPDKIVLLRKKDDIIINIDNIWTINYTKPTLINIFLAGLLKSYPEGIGVLVIWTKKKVGKSEHFQINIKYRDVLKLPEIYLKIIDSNKYGH